jgi:Tfp pilus assembly protein PilO
MGRMKQLWALTAVAVLAVLAGGWFLGAKPQSDKVGTLNESTQTQLGANSALSIEIKRLADLKKGMPAEQKRLRAIAANLPDNPALPSLVRSLSKIEESTNVHVISITPTAPALDTTAAAGPAPAGSAGKNPGVSAGSLASIPLTLNVTGTFADLQLFLSGLEKLQRSFVVGSLAIAPRGETASAEGGSADTGTLTGSITGRVFMRVAPAAAPAAAAPAAAAPAEK